jgi:hypothetical protein
MQCVPFLAWVAWFTLAHQVTIQQYPQTARIIHVVVITSNSNNLISAQLARRSSLKILSSTRARTLCTTGSMEHSIASHLVSKSISGICSSSFACDTSRSDELDRTKCGILYTRAEADVLAGFTASGRRLAEFGRNHTVVLLFASVNEQFHDP